MTIAASMEIFKEALTANSISNYRKFENFRKDFTFRNFCENEPS